MPGAAIILTLTRWHEDDLAGRILNGPGANQWETLILPALAEADDPLGRAIDESLWPSWYDAEALAALRAEIGARSFSALFQQRPAPAGGALFKREWWRWYEPTLLRHQGLKASFIAVDTASKAGLHNDYSVAAVWGELHGLYYLLDLWR